MRVKGAFGVEVEHAGLGHSLAELVHPLQRHFLLRVALRRHLHELVVRNAERSAVQSCGRVKHRFGLVQQPRAGQLIHLFLHDARVLLSLAEHIVEAHHGRRIGRRPAAPREGALEHAVQHADQGGAEHDEALAPPHRSARAPRGAVRRLEAAVGAALHFD
eukprot:scaffold7052_cov254-Pinguiococcus_pyrenoidosus.AAC.43